MAGLEQFITKELIPVEGVLNKVPPCFLAGLVRRITKEHTPLNGVLNIIPQCLLARLKVRRGSVMQNVLPVRKRTLIFIALSVGLTLFYLSGTAFAANEEGMEVLTRGPIHEAFADVSVDDTPTGPVINRPVPEPINEIPAEVHPEGNQVEWIPGYWSWDEDQNDFVWVSGIWRDIPPGRQWIPGYWLAVPGGNQYISGYWADIEQTATEYLPPPPQPLSAEPSSPAPAPDFVWIEGNWVWSHNGYAWQTGYWHEPRPDMIWTPAHYVWTPRGYIFVMGYWDYALDRRGLMFAPLYYPRPIYLHHGYYYQPHIVLKADTVFPSLFVRRNSHHYYFGDYYDPRSRQRGFRPWYSKQATRYGYDPYYRNYRSHRMHEDQQWEKNYQRQFESRRDHRDAGPPQRLEPTKKHPLNTSPSPVSQSIGGLFGAVIEKNNHSEKVIQVKPQHQQQILAPSGKDNNFQFQHNKFERVPYPQQQTRHAPDTHQPEGTRLLAVPGKSTKDNRKGRADQQSQSPKMLHFKP